VKRAQPKGREREQVTERRPYERDRNFGGAQNFAQNGFNGQQQPGMMNQMYGGMSPAVMAQWYQRMQAYYATAMGRGMMPGMPMGQPMMGMPNMNMQGMQMGGMPNMMGMGQQGFPQMGQGSPPYNQQYPQETSSHEGEYTYDMADQGPSTSQSSPPPNNSGDAPSGPRDAAGPPPNAPTGPSGLKPNFPGPRGRGGMRGGRGYNAGPGFQGGATRGGNVRFNPYGR
jgi:RNA-binding protein Musashi